MLIDKALLDELTARAKESPRLRMNCDLRNSPDDLSQRQLNALEPGTIVPIHRHKNTSEVIVILRGKLRWLYYDGQGSLIDSILLEAKGYVCGLSAPIGSWHSLECLESGTVILEAKEGAWTPLSDDEVMS